MGKSVIIGAGLVLAVGVVVFLALGRGSKQPSAQARFQARLEAARSGSGPERVVEGTVRSTHGTSVTPSGVDGAVAWAAWEQVRASAGSDFYKAENLQFGAAPFTLETSEGPLLVDGQLRGLSDLVQRERSAIPKVELSVVDGDQVTVLGPVSERDGVRGLFGEIIIVTASYKQWHAALDKTFFDSLPRAQ